MPEPEPMKSNTFALHATVAAVLATTTRCVAEAILQPVAVSDAPAPGTAPAVTFAGFNYVSLGNDGTVTFTANITGPGVTATNNLGLWTGSPSDPRLRLRAGDAVPGRPAGERFLYFATPINDGHQTVAFLARTGTSAATARSGQLFEATGLDPALAPVPIGQSVQNVAFTYTFAHGHATDALAGRVELSGAGVSPTNNAAIVAGLQGTLQIVARTGHPAPGTTGYFTNLSAASGSLALAPDAFVAFRATAANEFTATEGIWLRRSDATVPLVLLDHVAPVPALGPDYTFDAPTSDGVDINARGEVVFSARLIGAGLNNDNSEFLLAGTAGRFRIVAQAGQPVPGIDGATFRAFTGGRTAFGRAVIGTDGTVAFTACHSESGNDMGLWLAPADGSPPRLLARSGQPAPGLAANAVFKSSIALQPPVESFFLNRSNQVAFRSLVGGPGIAGGTFGVWLAESDGSVNLIACTGQAIDVGSGKLRTLSNVTFGVDAEPNAGPEDGRRTPIDDHGNVAVWLNWSNPPGPPDFGGFSQGVFLARPGFRVTGEIAGPKRALRFPTIAGRHYRIEGGATLDTAGWKPRVDGIVGTGESLVVEVPDAGAPGAQFYRVARLD